MHKFTLVHVSAPKGGRGHVRVEKVRASSPRAALARYEGRRLTVAEIAAMSKKRPGGGTKK